MSLQKSLGASVALVLVALSAEARDLTVVSWGGIFQDAQRETFFDPFIAETDAPLSEDSWDGGIGAIRTRIAAGAGNTWDVVQVEAEEEALGCEEGLFELIDPATVGGAERYVPGTLTDCGVPANAYSIVMAYDSTVFESGPTSWAEVWDTETFPGKRGFRQGPKLSLEAALMADGVDREDVYDVLATPEGVDRAFAKLDELRDDIVWWTSGNQPMQFLGSGEVSMTTTYNGRVRGANDEGRAYRLSWPTAFFMVDSWVILTGSPNADAALPFLEFMTRPEIQAQWPEKLGYGVGSVDAQAMITPELAADLPTAPENLAVSVPVNTEFWLLNIDVLNERFAAWAAQ